MSWDVGRQYRISYESESGHTTERTIDVLSTNISYEGIVYLRAFCHLRQEERTFRADRILDMELLTPGLAEPKPFLAPLPALAPMSVPAASKPLIAAPTPPRPMRRSFGDVVGTIFAYAISLAFLVTLLGKIGFFELYASSHSIPSFTDYGALPRPVPIAVPRPSPPQKPRVEDTVIAGTVLRTHRDGNVESYEVPDLGLSTLSKVEAIAAIRLTPFVEATGLTDPVLISRYLEADLNASGRLSFEELAAFQKKTYQEFRYESNELALSPHEFLVAGGGDCEDFALYTAGLLRFWAWEPYLGSLGPAGGGLGHAVCLSYEEGAFSDSYAYFNVSDWTAEDGTSLKDGRYIPIDYDQVGGISNAAKKEWKLRSIYIPEKAWGLRM